MKKAEQLQRGKFKSLLILDSIYHKSAAVLDEIVKESRVLEVNSENFVQVSALKSTSGTKKAENDSSGFIIIRNLNSLLLNFTKYEIVCNLNSLLKPNCNNREIGDLTTNVSNLMTDNIASVTEQRIIIIFHKDVGLGQDLLIYLKEACQNYIDLPISRSINNQQIKFHIKGNYKHECEYKTSPFQLVHNKQDTPAVQASISEAKPESTFNLKLNPKQEQARAELVLPHYEARTNDTEQQYLIEYEMDEFDDSDPDEDLEI